MCNVGLTLSTNQLSIFPYQLLSMLFMGKAAKNTPGMLMASLFKNNKRQALEYEHVFLSALLNAHNLTAVLSVFSLQSQIKTQNYKKKTKKEFPSRR